MWRLLLSQTGTRKIAKEIGMTPQIVYYYSIGKSTPKRKNLAALKEAILKFAPDKYQQFEISLNKELTGS